MRPSFISTLQQVDQLLCPADGERRDEHHTAPFDGPLDNFFETRQQVDFWMVSVAVGAFADQVIARRRR